MSNASGATTTEPADKRWQRLLVGRHPMRTLARLLVYFLVCFVVYAFVFRPLPIRVSGDSMVPTYHNGGINFVNLLSYRSHPPERGDVVAIRVATNLLYLKRVVALPGESIAMYHGKVTINGKNLDEPYIKKPGYQTIWPYLLGQDEYFLAGDNRSVSQVGTTSRSNILGKVLF